MLRWEKWRSTWSGYSGEKDIASFYKQAEGEYLWCVMKPFGDGVYRKASSDLAAKSAAEAAFKAWLQSAKLVHLPDGHVIVPTKMTPAMLKGLT